MNNPEIQFEAKRRLIRGRLQSSWRAWTAIVLTIVVLVGGCNRAYKELLAWDSAEDISFDVQEGDPSIGYGMLYRRWKSFQPTIFPDTESMQIARGHAGCCLLLRFWNRLPTMDRQCIIIESAKPSNGSEFEGELKQLVSIKIQIQLKGIKSLSPEQLKFWNETSGNFGNQSRQ